MEFDFTQYGSIIIAMSKILSQPARKRTSAQKRLFLGAFEKTGSKTAAARAAKIDRTTHYKWLESDAEYQKEFEAAEQRSIDGLEDEAWRRAHAGSDGLMMFLLRGLRPDRYRERLSADVSGTVNLVQILEAQQRVVRMRERDADSQTPGAA